MVITLDNVSNQQYIGRVEVGTPKQELSMLFDTGSAVIYMMSDKCSPGDCPEKMPKYDTRSTSLSHDWENRQELNYGQGYVSGSIGRENICFTSDKCLSSVQMLVGDQGKQLEADKFSGIIGLAPQNDPNNKLSSFIEQVALGRGLKPVFSFYLPKDKPGKLMLGGYDVSQFSKGKTEKDITWSSVSSDEKTWSAAFNGLRFKGGPHISTKSEKIMLDTGLSYALVPTADVESVAKALMGYGLDCHPPGFTGRLDLYQCTKCPSDTL